MKLLQGYVKNRTKRGRQKDMTFKLPEKLPEKWLKIAEDHRGTLVKTGRDSFKVLHDGKNQNGFGNPLLPDWKDITVTEDANFVSVNNADGFVFKFRKGTAGYNEIWLEGAQLIADERWVLEYLKTGQWRQRGEPQSVTWEQPQPYHVVVRRFYRDFGSPETSFYVVWDFYGGFRPKISVAATIGQGDTYRLRWSVSGINKNNFGDETSKRRVRLWNLDEKAVVLDYTDVYGRLGDITSVDSSEWAGGKKLTLSFNVGALVVGGFRLDPTFGYETGTAAWTADNYDYIVGSVFTCPAAGTATKISAYLYGSATGPGPYAAKAKCAIYKHSDLSLVAKTLERTWAVEVPEAWYDFTFTVNPGIIATDYVLVVFVGATVRQYVEISYADGDGPDPGQQGHLAWKAYNDFPNPLVPTHEDRMYSIYCTYTAGAPAVGGLKMIPSLKGHMGYDLKTRGGKARRRIF